jgi:GAF domain-containing protein
MPRELDRTWQLLDDFAEAAQLLWNYAGDPDAADTVCDLALRVVGADHASISRVRGGQFTTIASTSVLPEQADKIQYKAGSGPCLDEVREPGTVRVEDLATDPRWPVFGATVSAELGMRSMLVHVLPLEDHALVVNAYSAMPHAFTVQHEKAMAVFASAAVTAMRAARHQEKAEHLERALHTSRRIGVALGIVMATRGVNLDDAWELLSKASQDSNTKVAELSDHVIRTGSLEDRWRD